MVLSFSKSTWVLLILADVFLLAVDLPSVIFGTLSLGLALAAVLVFYFVMSVAAFVVFSMSEFMSGRSMGHSLLNGFIAAVLLVIPLPVASILAFMFSVEAGYGRGYRSYAYLMIFLVLLLPVSLAQVPVVASRLSSWGYYSESVCYKVYEVSVAFTGDWLKDDVMSFVQLRLAARNSEFATLNVLAIQGSAVDSGDLKRSSAALARDARIAGLIAPDLISTPEGRASVMRAAGLSSSAVSSAQSVLQLVGSSGDAASDVGNAAGSSMRLAAIGMGVSSR